MRLIDPFRVRGQIGFGRQHGARGLQDVPASAVIGRHGEMQAVVVGGALLRRENEFLQPRLEGREIADHVQPHALLFELADLALQRLDEQPHQQGDLFGGTPPVLGAEREQRQVAHAGAPAGLDHAPDGLHALGVSRRVGSRRRVAHLPLPSMMMATCCGVSRVSGTAWVELVAMESGAARV